jgi:hypothetical protein
MMRRVIGCYAGTARVQAEARCGGSNAATVMMHDDGMMGEDQIL